MLYFNTNKCVVLIHLVVQSLDKVGLKKPVYPKKCPFLTISKGF